MEIYSEGSTLILDDFKKLSAYGLKTGLKTMNSKKGHFEELEELAKAMQQRKWLIPWEEMEEATRISLEVDKQVRQKIGA